MECTPFSKDSLLLEKKKKKRRYETDRYLKEACSHFRVNIVAFETRINLLSNNSTHHFPSPRILLHENTQPSVRAITYETIIKNKIIHSLNNFYSQFHRDRNFIDRRKIRFLPVFLLIYSTAYYISNRMHCNVTQIAITIISNLNCKKKEKKKKEHRVKVTPDLLLEFVNIN